MGDPVEMAAQRVRDAQEAARRGDAPADAPERAAKYFAARMAISEEDIRKRADGQAD